MRWHGSQTGRRAAAVLLWVMLAGRASAEAPRALGSHTGDGSTAFTGLAQAPEAKLFVGAATTSIPIEVPPGRKDLTPKLALTYSSGGGPSPYGYGWDLLLGKIQRSTKHGVPSCSASPYQNDFVLVLPGTSLECRLDTGTNNCSAVVEESFLRIQYDPADDHWEVWDKSGLHYVFGDVQSAREPVYPECSTFSWSLTHIEDPNGNTADIVYIVDDTPQGALSGVSYPASIRYGGNRRLALPHLFEIKFVWSDEDGFSRPAGDLIVNSIGGFTAMLTKLLSRIEVHYPVGGPRVRWYSFAYDFQTSSPADARVARQSFLTAVTLFDDADHALARTDGLPASTTFLYHEGVLGFFWIPQSAPALPVVNPPAGRWTTKGNSPGDQFRTYRDIVDIDGDGIPDLIDTQPCTLSNPYWQVFPGSKQGFASSPLLWQVPDPSRMCMIRESMVTNDCGDTGTYIDLIDMNGDGIPDFVDSSRLPAWAVYLGRAPTSSSGGRFDAPLDWTVPQSAVRAVSCPKSPDFTPPIYSHYTFGDVDTLQWEHGSADTQDLMDVNGDGLPDLVQAPTIGASGPWKVWLNSGSGFETGTGTDFPVARSALLRYTTSDGTQVIGVYDINGDGLPDQILNNVRGVWTVFLNSGHGMTTETSWTAPDACGHTGIRAVSNHDVIRDFFDINGDGLPDLVTACGSNWQVYFNRGAGFAPQPVTWRAPDTVIRDLDDSATLTLADTFDADGDGLVDFVRFQAPTGAMLIYHNAGGAWCVSSDGVGCTLGGSGVAANPLGVRPDVLEQIENGLGGTTSLEYRPSTQWLNTTVGGSNSLPFVTWTLTRIERDDGLCDDQGKACVSPGSHSLQSEMRYGFGLFDANTREFRGFGTVEQYDADGNLQTTWFRQDAARQGKVYAANSYAADAVSPYSKLLVYAFNTWDCVDLLSNQPAPCPQAIAPSQRLWVRLREADRFETRNYTLDKLAFSQNLAWDAYGNVTHTTKGGTGTGSVHTYTDYAVPTDTQTYVVDKPVHVQVADTAIREEKWFAYDDRPLGQVTRGNLTTAFNWLDGTVDPHLPTGGACPQPPATGVGACVTTQMAYDRLGNLISTTDAQNHSTVTTYDATTQLYPYTVTNSLNQQVATSYDPGCGKLLWQSVTYPDGTDPVAQPRTQYAYDTFCRLHATALPGASLDQPQRVLDYFIGTAQQASDVRTLEAVAGTGLTPKRWVTYYELFDALGRHLQTQRAGFVDGKRTTVIEGTVSFDDRGNQASRYAPFLGTASSKAGASKYVTPAAAAGSTTFSYDPLNRVTQIVNPDGSVRAFEYNVPWQTVTKDECYTARTCPGAMTIEIRDAFGRPIERRMYDGDTFQTRTGYTYDAMGRLLTTTQGETLTSWATQTALAITYDSLGRKIQMTDPDSGSWKYGYDLVGNLIFQDDPQSNQHIEFCYDALNRVTDKMYGTNRDGYGPSHCGTVRGAVAYNYDEANSPSCATAPCLGGNCGLGRLTSVVEQSGSSTSRCYDVRGRTVRLITAVAAAERITAAQTSFAYDAADHVTTMIYPDGEVVRYSYDPVGQVRSMKGAKTYLKSLTYDRFGRPRQVIHGNRVIDTWTYGEQTTNFRLASIEATRSKTRLLSYAYTSYLPTGRLQQLTDKGALGASNSLDNTATFSYDGLGRLTGVDGPNLRYGNGYAYDSLGNMTGKEGSTLGYAATHPHTLATINGSSAGIAHDANGNRKAKPGQTYSYDADGRLTSITMDAGGTVSFVYDHTGHRVAKLNGASVTRYYGTWAEAGDGYLTKRYFAAGLLVASQRVANAQLADAPITPLLQVTGNPTGQRLGLIVSVRPDVRATAALTVFLSVLAVLAIPGRRRAVVGMAIRRGPVIALILVFVIVSLPLPITVRPAAAYQSGVVMHYHVDHLGSTQVVTNSRGGVVRYIRYKPYGEVRGRFNADGTLQATDTCTANSSCREFTGYDSEPLSGLEYAGARFYDPALGMFLSHDPARQFANPYCYVGWNPTNATDPNGEFIGELLTAAIIAAVVSAAVNVVIAAAQGADLSQIGKAAVAGAVTGAVGAGIGVVVSGVSVGLASLAGTLPQDVGLNQALNALGEVAYRSAFSATIANAAGQTASAAGAPSGAVTGVSIAAGYGASYVYDTNVIDYSGDLARIEGKGAFKTVSNTTTHTSLTEQAAAAAGFNQSESSVILQSNLAQDLSVANNEAHFDSAAKDTFARFAAAAKQTGGPMDALRNVGAASHYLQDQYTLGHIFPGTHLLAGSPGALFRAIIHQTVGGEVSFFSLIGGLRVPSSFDATLDYLEKARSAIPEAIGT